MLRSFFPDLVMSTDRLSFEHPSVLLFCWLQPQKKSYLAAARRVIWLPPKELSGGFEKSYLAAIRRDELSGCRQKSYEGQSKITETHLWFAGARKCPPWCSIVGATVTVHQFFCILHFCLTYSRCRVKLVVQFPSRGSTQVLLCLFLGVLWLWHFLYIVGPHPVPSLHIYTFVVSRAFMADAASQAG